MDKSTLVQVISQAIIWANVDQDLYRHMASIGHIELSHNEITGDYHLIGVTVAYLANMNDIQRTNLTQDFCNIRNFNDIGN